MSLIDCSKTQQTSRIPGCSYCCDTCMYFLPQCMYLSVPGQLLSGVRSHAA